MEKKKERGPDRKTIQLLNDLKNEIKNRQKNEAALAENEKKLKSYIDNAPYAIFVVNEKGQYTESNAAANLMLGYSNEEIINSNILQYIHPDDHPIAKNHFEEVVKKGEASANLRSIRKDGQTRHFTVKAVKLSETRFIGFKEDITEKIKYEQELRLSEERFRSLFDYNPYAVFVWMFKEGDFVLTMVNKTADEITQNHASGFIGSKAGEIYKDLPLMVEKLNECYATKKPIEFEHYYKTRYAGHYEWVYFKFAFVEPDTVLLFSKIITHRKKTEQQLIKAKEEAEKREKEYIDLVQALGEGHLKANTKGIITAANRSIAEMCGYASPEEMIGIHMLNLYANPDDRPAMIRKLKEKGMLKNYELMLRKKDGSLFWSISNIRVIVDHKGKITGTEGLIRDINALKTAEKSLRESEEMYRLIAENTSDGIISIDPEGRIKYASPAYLALFGHSKTEITQFDKEAIYQFMHPQDRDTVFEKIFNAIKEKKTDLIYSYRFNRKKKGIYMWREDHAKFKYDRQGNFMGTNVICRDITKRKQAEKALQEIEIAKKTAVFKQNFLANMSHEIRTPLTGVLGMIDILEQTELSAQQLEYLNTIKFSGENLKQIIDQVLDYSKIESGKINVKPEVFQFISIPESARLLYSHKVKGGVSISLDVDPLIPDFIYADKYRLLQVLNNLLYNAIKHTYKGSIEIKASLLEDDAVKNKIVIKFSVADTGVGIPLKMQKNLFAPFSQIEDKDTQYHEGTGLGLSICKGLVKILKGKIGVESKPGKGSTFWFTFTAKKADAPAAIQPDQSPAIIPGKLHILFAEDKLVNQKVVCLMLTSLGHEVTIANNGQEALDLFETGKTNLILMDIQMPVMDGITATQKLKEKYDNLPPIIGLSANAFEGDREKYMALGMDEYLTKPVKKGDFEELIEKLFSTTQNPQSG